MANLSILDGKPILKTDFRDEAYQVGFWDGEYFCYNVTGHEVEEDTLLGNPYQVTHWKPLKPPEGADA